MLKAMIAVFMIGGASIASAQAHYTASRIAEGQVGGTFVNGNSDYERSRFNGYSIFADLDFHKGFGAEVKYQYISDYDQNLKTYERTYEVGGRYSRHYGRYQPYAKLMIGRGVFNYPYSVANLASNMGAIGGGVDVHLTRRFSARADYEYQRWFGFSRSGYSANNDSLTPSMFSIGGAYHF